MEILKGAWEIGLDKLLLEEIKKEEDVEDNLRDKCREIGDEVDGVTDELKC